MLRYWVIAPAESKPAELFDKVWQFDVANNVISIGWSGLGDVSKMSRDGLADAIESEYPDKPPTTWSLFANMIWAFYHEIRPGDMVIARRGRKALAAVGEVVQPAVYAPGRNPACSHGSFLDVAWQRQPRDKVFPSVVFPMPTLGELTEDRYRTFVDGTGGQLVVQEAAEALENPSAFVLEKYLEDFIVSNFGTIFKGKLQIYEDAEGNDGQQYATGTGPIDILAVETKSKSFVIIELKKGRPSDQVVGQVLRYMGWVKQNLCKVDQGVKGVVICGEPDPKLIYALSMTTNIELQYYSVTFKLSDAP